MTRWNTLLACALLSSTAIADQTLTLQDGKQVLLKDDFTWEYVTQISEIAGVLPAIPVAKGVRGTTVKLGDSKPSLQLSKSGVDVLIGAGSYESGQLIFPVSMTNQSTQAVVLVTLQYSIFSPSGELLHEGSTHIWQSIKRLADTYLRPQTSAEGKQLAIEAKQYPEYRIEVNITDVTTR